MSDECHVACVQFMPFTPHSTTLLSRYSPNGRFHPPFISLPFHAHFHFIFAPKLCSYRLDRFLYMGVREGGSDLDWALLAPALGGGNRPLWGMGGGDVAKAERGFNHGAFDAADGIMRLTGLDMLQDEGEM